MDVKSFMCIAKQNFDLIGFIDKNLENSEPFHQVVERFKKKYKIPKQQAFQNHFAFVPYLYSIFLVLREDGNNKNKSEESKIPDIKIFELNEKWHLSRVTLEKNDNNKNADLKLLDKKLKNIVDNIRHAIAHFHIECSENLEYTLINKGGNVKIEMKAEDLYSFSRALNYYILTKDLELKDL